MGPRAERLLLNLRVAVVVLLDDLVRSHVLVGGASDRRRVIHVLRALALHGITRHDLLHGLELLHVALGLVQRHVIGGRAVALASRHHHRSHRVGRVDDAARVLLRELHLAALRAHGHVRGLLVQIRHDVVLAEQGLRLLYHDARAPKLLIQDVLVIHNTVVRNARCRRSLLGNLTRVVKRWGLLLERRRRVADVNHLSRALQRVVE
mmetsp:Transcript_722/g.1093  ORF Transcript_722/g.1093 Transcript_722/m.1093 type:complete len:207 (-) Transcript_722:1792-2412(-)